VGDRVHVTIQHPNSTDTFAADVTQRDSQKCGLLLADMTTLQSIRWVQCTFARADTWTQWADKRKADRPLRALGQVAIMGLRGFKVLLNSIGAALSHRARRRPS
jgi:cellulose synthase (UDP-forming)